jgi:hypothetical protein
MSDRKQQLLDLLKDKQEMDEDTSDIEAELFQMDEMEKDMGRSDGSSRIGEQSEKFTPKEQEKLQDAIEERKKVLEESKDEKRAIKRSMGSPITGEKLKTVGGGISRGGGIAVKGIKFKGVF